MIWQDALEIAIANTKHERYRTLTADDHPDHDIWRRRMVEVAGGEYPPLLEQAGNALGALGRVAGAVLTGEPVKVSDEVYAERTAICRGCDRYDTPADRCTACGCNGVKRWLATERCPLDPPKWDQWVVIENG